MIRYSWKIEVAMGTVNKNSALNLYTYCGYEC